MDRNTQRNDAAMPADMDRMESLGYEVAEGELDIRGYDVHDQGGQKIGTVENLLGSRSQERAFCAIVKGESGLQGRRVVIPLGYFGINQMDNRVTVPFTQEQFRGAPAYEEGVSDTSRYTSYWSKLGAAAGAHQASGRAPAATDRKMDRQSGEIRVAETAEEAQVRKVSHQTGSIGLRKRVETETKHLSTPVTHTDVTVERRAVASGEAYTADPNATTLREGETLRVPIVEEEVVVDKKARVTGEVVLRTKTETDVVEQDVQLRRERVEVDEDVEEEAARPADRKR